jgi:hypothetical protein
MNPVPIREFVLTGHALFEMGRRGLTEEAVVGVLRQPEQRWELRPGRHILQSKVTAGEPPRAYIVRVIVDIDDVPPVVVTAYRTSKVLKYWRHEP